jgi:hypothetical protein
MSKCIRADCESKVSLYCFKHSIAVEKAVERARKEGQVLGAKEEQKRILIDLKSHLRNCEGQREGCVKQLVEEYEGRLKELGKNE